MYAILYTLKKAQSIKTFLFALMMLAWIVAPAQQFTSNQDESSMTISGTSTLHDWDSAVEDFTATCKMDGDEMQSASFKAKVESIKSGTRAMDQNTYNAMDSKKFPNISFTSKSIKNDGNFITVSGSLTIAGESKSINLKLKREQWTAESLNVSGEYTLKMSEYGIDPPRAMLGTIRTGDEVTISFDIALYKS